MRSLFGWVLAISSTTGIEVAVGLRRGVAIADAVLQLRMPSSIALGK